MNDQKTNVVWRFSLSGLMIAAALGLLGGCQDGYNYGSNNLENPPGSTSCIPSTFVGASGNGNATSRWIQDNVWTPRCISCHGSASPSAGLSWTEANACNNVNRASTEITSMILILPDTAAASYMVWKLNGAGPNEEPINGARMPANGPPYLDAPTMLNITDWISDGAVFD